jgi:hypothetical protein
MDTEMSEETTVWRDGKIFGKHIPRLGEETGKPDSGRASMIGSWVYLIEISPKYTGAQAVGYIKGKSAIEITRRFVRR